MGADVSAYLLQISFFLPLSSAAKRGSKPCFYEHAVHMHKWRNKEVLLYSSGMFKVTRHIITPS